MLKNHQMKRAKEGLESFTTHIPYRIPRHFPRGGASKPVGWIPNWMVRIYLSLFIYIYMHTYMIGLQTPITIVYRP